MSLQIGKNIIFTLFFNNRDVRRQMNNIFILSKYLDRGNLNFLTKIFKSLFSKTNTKYSSLIYIYRWNSWKLKIVNYSYWEKSKIWFQYLLRIRLNTFDLFPICKFRQFYYRLEYFLGWRNPTWYSSAKSSTW